MSSELDTLKERFVMNRSESTPGHWNWIFHGPDGRNAVSAWAWTLAFMVLLTIGGLPYGPVETGEFRTFSGWRWILVLTPVVPGLMAIVAWRRYLRNAEEMLKKIYTEAAGLAFAVAVVLFIGIYIGGRIVGGAQADDASLIAFTIVLLTFVFTVQRQLGRLNA
jgi:hypothetical protein